MTNRLAKEQSPYLLQHEDNPVDWYPWGEEAFARAREEDKPIFLSIGYSTCHWCHVMAHESFEDGEVAGLLNRDFVSIKVDREERPDVDRVYMSFVQATTGSGGWPMSVWLTPALEPFYGGTYYPPTSRWGRPGFVDVLAEVARVWRDERGKVTQSAAAIMGRLRALGSAGRGAGVPGVEVLAHAVAEFDAAFDKRRGGFGSAPKFPRPSGLLFLLREHARTGAATPRAMVLQTLEAMALGGMRDHLGGGFHRYSVDGDWRVPHFEKMLYDQAQLVLAYVEGAQASGDRFYAEVAADTLAYVERDLMDPGGAFYSAEDADSVPPEREGEAHPRRTEGAFYIWRADEIREVAGADADVFVLRYGVEPDGNAPADPQGEFTGRNLLYTALGLEDIASRTGLVPAHIEASLARARAALMERRGRRPRPHLDDKVLTAWNGLMIAAFGRAGRVLENGAHYVSVARRAAAFLRAHLWQADRQVLLRRYRRGQAAVDGYAEDYAYLIFGLIELFQAEGDAEWLEWALTLQRRQDALFWDAADGGWFSTTGEDASVLLRLKEDYDGAEPAATSVSVLNLLTLSHLTGDVAMAGRIDATLSRVAAREGQSGRSVPMMLVALSMFHAGAPQIVLAGEPGDADREALAAVIRQRYLPTALTIPLTESNRDSLADVLPWIAGMSPKGGRATAYVCREFACLAPTTSETELAARLAKI